MVDVGMKLSVPEKALIELYNNGVLYIVLREPTSWEKAKDIDILVLDNTKATKQLLSMGYTCYAETNNHKWYLKFDRDTDCWIHLDVHIGLKFGNVNIPREFIEQIFIRATLNSNGIPLLECMDMWFLLFFHSIADKRIMDQRYKCIITTPDLDKINDREYEYSFLPVSISVYLELIAKFNDNSISENELVIAVLSSLGFACDKPKKAYARRIYMRLLRMVKNSGEVVFLGPDGAGKSTLIEPLLKLKHQPIRGQYMGPGRASEQVFIITLLMRCCEKGRNLFSKYNPLGLSFRLLWHIMCYFDFIIRKFRHLWFQAGGGCVLYDRYACDMYFRSFNKMSEQLYIKLFPKPKYVVFCMGNANLINKRKPELSEEELVKTITLYSEKFEKYKIPYLKIDTTVMNEDECLSFVLCKLAERKWGCV